MREIRIIGVPSSAGARQVGQERAPSAFREAGLIQRLRSAGHRVTDLGDLPGMAFRPDPEHPRAQNLPLVVDIARRVADQVQAAVRNEALLILLGGDCTITLGAVSGMIEHTPNLGLMYFDGDVDLNTPGTTPSGIFDGMVISHLIGTGADDLARLGPRFPLMQEENIVLFGYNPEAGSIDAAELESLQLGRMEKYPVSRIRGRPEAAAQEALGHIEGRADSILVHFDVDVVDFGDFPAGDVPHYGGLTLHEAMIALHVFVASPKSPLLAITEFNTDRDPDGKLAVRLVEALAGVLSEDTI